MAMAKSAVRPEWASAIDEWAWYARRQHAAPTTIKTRTEHLELASRRLEPGPWDVTERELLEWWEAQHWGRETSRSRRASYRVFWGWAAEVGHVEESPALILPKVRPAPPRPNPTPDAAYDAALRAATPRERLMLRLSAEVGMRRGEVAQVWPQRDLFRDLLGWSIVAHGKGDKDRSLPLEDDLAAELLASGPGWLFPGRTGGHLTPRYVGTLVRRLLPDEFTMHSNRHRFATRLHEETHDLPLVRDALGHASVATTQLYVATDSSKLRGAMAQASRRGRPAAVQVRRPLEVAQG